MWNSVENPWNAMDYYHYYPQQEVYEDSYLNYPIDPTYGNFQTDPQYQLSEYNTNLCLNYDLNQFTVNNVLANEPVFETFSQNTEELEQYEFEQLMSNELSLGNCIQTFKGDPLLHWAIMKGFVESACAMIKTTRSELLNMLNNDGQSPLHLAVLTKQPRIIRELILAGANLEVTNFRGNTPLHLSCSIGDFDSVIALTTPLNPMEYHCLRPGIKVPTLPQNLELRNYDGQMCMHIAVSSNHIKFVRLLMDYGANVEAKDGLTGNTALHLAVERGYESIIMLLLKKSQTCLNLKNYAGKTAYQIARNFNSQYTKILKKKN